MPHQRRHRKGLGVEGLWSTLLSSILKNYRSSTQCFELLLSTAAHDIPWLERTELLAKGHPMWGGTWKTSQGRMCVKATSKQEGLLPSYRWLAIYFYHLFLRRCGVVVKDTSVKDTSDR